MKHACHLSSAASIVACLFLSSSVLAQDLEEDLQEQDDQEEAEFEETEDEADQLDDGDELEQDTAEGQALGSPPPETVTEEQKREKEEPQFLLGARYRMLIIPKFLVNWFGVEGATDVITHGVGPEFGFNHPDFEILLSAWFADYGMAETPFKGPNDGPEAWELVTSRLKQVYISSDFLWKNHLNDDWDIHIGAGAGVGIVFGDLDRWEAQWTNGASVTNPGDPYTDLGRCPGGTGSAECPFDGNYGTGEPWPVYPWLTFQTGVRYSPVKEFVARLDLGAGSSGFWLGLGVDYGL